MLLWLQPEQRFRPNEGLFLVFVLGSCFGRFLVSILAHFVTLCGALGACYRQSGVSLGALDGGKRNGACGVQMYVCSSRSFNQTKLLD